ncbi:zinc finger BED domain-containing protein [Pimephales promelas]|nr:zinc finger BED domain-containing protein [Pimephales promelas]
MVDCHASRAKWTPTPLLSVRSQTPACPATKQTEIPQPKELKGDSYRLKCLLCLPRVNQISAFKNSPSNLKKHIERKHPHQLESYSKLTQSHNSSQKRKCPKNPPAGTSKQLKLDMSTSKRVSQVNINKAVMKFVVEGLQPFSVVDLQAFKDLIQDLQPNATIMSRPTLRSSIAEATKSMKKKLIAAMSEVEYIATTTDCRTTRRRSFIGITAHWLDPDSLDRHSVALACRQLKCSHTFEVLAAALNDIHAEYQIRDKIVRTTTDNGSNFLKAFRVYGDQDENNNATYTEELSNSGDGDDDEEEIQEEEEVVNYQEVASVLDIGDGFEYHLPKHQRCACHLLNLVSTVDALMANSNEAYKNYGTRVHDPL